MSLCYCTQFQVATNQWSQKYVWIIVQIQGSVLYYKAEKCYVMTEAKA